MIKVILTAFGETKPLSEWLLDKKCKVKCSTLHYRIKTGWNAEDAISKPSPRKKFKVNNKFKILKEVSKDPKCKVCYKTLHNRIKAGMPLEEAMQTESQLGRLYEAFGKTQTLKEWTKDTKCKVSYQVLYARVCKRNWNFVEALTTNNLRKEYFNG